MSTGRSRVRRYVAVIALMAGFAVVLFQLVNLHVLQAAKLSLKADRQHRT